MTLLNALLERADLNSLFNELDALTEEYATSLQRLQLHEGLDEISDILSDKAKKLSDNIQRVQLIRDRTREEMKDGRMDKKDAIRHQHKAVVSMQKDLKTVSGLIGKFNTAIDRYIEKTKHLSKDPELSDLLKKKRQQDKGNDDLGGQDDQLASDLAKIRKKRQQQAFDNFGNHDQLRRQTYHSYSETDGRPSSKCTRRYRYPDRRQGHMLKVLRGVL